MGFLFRSAAIRILILAVSLISAMLLPATASATCTTTGNNTTCSGSTTLGGSSIGNGPSGPDNATVTVTTGATVTSGPGTVISLRDYAIINIEDNATVTGHAGVGGSGLYVAGKNTIEFRSYGVLTIGQGATVNAAGTSTDSNAIDMIGQGNTINNYGTISSTNAVAIWFEDQVVGAANVINNYGTIQSGNGSSQSVIGNTVGSGGSSDVYFTNYTGAVVYGSLLFGGGNDVLTLYPSSVVTGSFDGGGGTNTLTLAGTVGSSDTLSGSINNFQFLTKIGQGTWTLTGTVGNSSGGPLAVEVQQGTLVLTGNNTSFNGSVLVDSAGILQARAQSLPPSITDNGLVNFAQPDDGTYAGIISGSGAVSKTGGGILTLSGNNTYQGGTLIQGGTVAVSADNQLGDPSGSITLDGGTLELTSSFNLSSSRAMTVTANNGTIQTDSGVTSTVSQAISGAGALTAAGSGSLILANTNTYSGGTTISGGTLQIGAGGTTGSIVGDVVNNGALVFNRSDISTFSGLISGTGTVNQAGAGVTILSANNTYAGPTTISSGWLYIDGDQSGAGGAVTANPGTRLGGNGIIGGDVTIADNATLSPGSHPRDANTITINGDLTLSNNAILLSNLFQANVAGGALNDLTIVNGDLYLGGVINVVDLGNGQVLGPGVYRLIDYSGTLYASDGSAYNSATGLQVGNYVTAPANPQETSTPTGPLTGFSVQTAIPGQINLVNSTGLILTYWDGDLAINKDNNVIDGGNGLWQSSGGNNNWTGVDGAVNGVWDDGGYGIFIGSPGTVTVDNSTGTVTASGMQFAVDGYVVTGQALTLVSSGDGTSHIRVGDGTQAGAAMTATIASELTGAVTLVKDDFGTLILSGANTYTGGTLISGGTLQISSDNNLGDLASNSSLTIANGSTLSTTATFSTSRSIYLSSAGTNISGGVIDTVGGTTTLTVSGVVADGGQAAYLIKDGAGTLVLTNANTYSGGTTISGGTLQIGDGNTTGSIIGDVVDNGTLAFNRSDTVTFGGAISGTGSVNQMGSGTTVLTNTNTYSGGTTISSGTLQIGAGGTAGSIVGDVANNGALVFNRSDISTFSGLISGTGTVNQAGSGVTILSANNTYAGPTTISSGWLYIDGDQSGATGTLTANPGTRLGGNGIIGGDVILADNATLSPGSHPRDANTITINGDLTLSNNSILFYNLLQASVAGGALNDLTVVDGNLYLGGVINVVDLGNGQVLGPGVYRIINYSGTLYASDGSAYNSATGLQIGNYATAPANPQGTSTPTGPLTGFSVQTAITGQVNLVNSTGLTLTYWDTIPNNGVVDGGTGTWQSSFGSNWTDANGAINAPWADGGYGIFIGSPGIVTVDNSTGTVTASGMQFAVDGYVVEGDALTLSGGPISHIRVGDGTTAGSAMTATIDSVLTGAVTLAKDDLGTLILGGANTYTGSTVITGGTLQISSDNNLGDLASNSSLVIANNSTLSTTATFSTSRSIYLSGDSSTVSGGIIDTTGGTTLTVSGVVADLGSPATLTKAGAGTLVLTNANTYSGGTTISGGTLQIGDGNTTGSIVGDVVDNGVLAFNRSDAVTFGGAISGTGSVNQMGSGTTILTNTNTYSGGTTISSGTLQIGAGGTTGSIIGDVVDNSALVFNRSDIVTFSGAISGTGSASQIGSGTTILTNTNTYSGGTTISNGTLQIGDGGTTGSIVGDVTDNGVLAFNRSDTMTFGGAISGSGAVNQIGSGTTVLTNANTYTGGTTISSGTLQIGAGGTTGSIVGNVTDNGALVFNRSDIVTYSGQVIGSGSLIQQGSGTTILTGNSTYAGGTTINSGTLQLGNGGTMGSIVGDILNNGTLTINHSNLLPLTGTISGSGNVVQQGSGSTVLLGNNAYSGTTLITGGELYIDGDQSAATGQTTVASGGIVGGTGTIGGDVVVNSGGTLSPGAVGAIPGTLTIKGNLTEDSGSAMLYHFGQANVVGGALNDLTVVEGNLVLNGTLNVQTTQEGAFDTGIYRVISYGGSLTDNGLVIGTIPSPNFYLQTAVKNQVNLVNTSGLTLSFWDGIGPKNDSIIDGGSGVWQSSSGNDNWTDTLGVPNGAFADNSFAVFMAASGTVIVDNSFGNVSVGGMQFAIDGYMVTGDALTLVDAPTTPGVSVIRVGDGSSLGAGYTATIDSILTGNVTLLKADLGTLILNGANTYTGGTAINGGVLQISADSNLGVSGSALSLNGGTLRTMANFTAPRNTTLGNMGGIFDTLTGTTFTLSGTVAGTGSLTKIGGGTMVLTADNTYTGGTVINGGVLQISADSNLGDSSGLLSLNGGTLGTTANFTSARSTTLGDQGGTFDTLTGTTFTLSGTVTGSGSLTKTGEGTLVLTAADTYAAGTTITQGTLQLGNGGTTGSIIGNVIDNGALAFNRSDVYAFNGVISGTGEVLQIGSGTTVLTGASTYSGSTFVNAGILRAGASNVFSPNSAFTVAAGGTLDLNGFSQTIKGLSNAGIVAFNDPPKITLTVTGNYVGMGGAMIFNAYLGDSTSVSDSLVIDGGSATGNTSVFIASLGGQGAQTTGNGILLVDAINGGTTTATAFALGAPVIAGPYEYLLYRGGVSGDLPDDWFLRSTLDCELDPNSPACRPNFRSETSLYTAIPSLALNYGNMLLDSLDERMGGQRSLQRFGLVGQTGDIDRRAWGRIIATRGSRDGGSSGIYSDRGPSYNHHTYALQVGLDVYAAGRANGGFDNAGFYFANGETSATVRHFDGTKAGTNRTNATTLGGYWTHFGKRGWYLDTVVQGTWYDNKAYGRLSSVKTKGFGLGASLEAGYPVLLNNGVMLQPQAQLTYQTINLDDSYDMAAKIGFDNVQSLIARLGARLSKTWTPDSSLSSTGVLRKTTAWGRVSFINEFLGRPETRFSSANGDVPFRASTHGAGFKIDAGIDTEIAKGVSFYGSLQFQREFGGSDYAFGGKIGLKAVF